MKHLKLEILACSLLLSCGLVFSGERAQYSTPVPPAFYSRNQVVYEVSSSKDSNSVELIPGQGFEVIDDLVAIRKGDLFHEAIEEAANREVQSGERIANPQTISMQSMTDVTEEFEAKMLFTAFSTKLSGFGAKLNASMSRDRAREELRKNTIMYIIAKATGGKSLDVRDSLLNLNDPKIKTRLDALEAEPDTSRRRDLFIQNFGTHYVRRVEHGFSLIIRVSMASVNKSDVDKLHAAMSARGWGQSASAEVRKTTINTLNSLNCMFDIQVVGKVEPVWSVISTPDFTNVLDIINKIQTGEIKIYENPVSYTLAPYSSFFSLMGKEYPNLAAMFRKVIPQEPIDNFLPVGTLLPFAGVHMPSGFLLCDGKTYMRNEYPRLFEAIGTTYGTTREDDFKVPDFSGRMLMGAGSSTDEAENWRYFNFGTRGGEYEHTLTEQEMPKHKHEYLDVYYSEYINASPNSISVPNNLGSGRTDLDNRGHQLERNDMSEAGQGVAHNNLPPYLTVNYIIKY